MAGKEQIRKMYEKLLRMTKYYMYYAYQFQGCNTNEDLTDKKKKLWQEFLGEFHFLNFFPQDCLNLAYQDNCQKIKSKKH